MYKTYCIIYLIFIAACAAGKSGREDFSKYDYIHYTL